MVRYGRGRIRLLRKHRDTLSLKTLVPGVFLLACVLGALLACFSRSLAVCALAGAASYVAILLAASIAIAVKHRDPAIVPWLPCVFATVHVGAGVGLLWEACLPRGINRQEQRPLATSPLAKSSPASGEGEGSA
jgi:CHASE2 domain-containing sensor protein